MTRIPAAIDIARSRHSKPRRLAAVLSSALLAGGLASCTAALKIESDTTRRAGAAFSETTLSLPGISFDWYHNEYPTEGRSYAGRLIVGDKGTSFSYSNLDKTRVLGFGILSYSYLFQAKKGPSGYEFSSQTW